MNPVNNSNFLIPVTSTSTPPANATPAPANQTAASSAKTSSAAAPALKNVEKSNLIASIAALEIDLNEKERAECLEKTLVDLTNIQRGNSSQNYETLLAINKKYYSTNLKSTWSSEALEIYKQHLLLAAIKGLESSIGASPEVLKHFLKDAKVRSAENQSAKIEESDSHIKSYHDHLNKLKSTELNKLPVETLELYRNHLLKAKADLKPYFTQFKDKTRVPYRDTYRAELGNFSFNDLTENEKLKLLSGMREDLKEIAARKNANPDKNVYNDLNYIADLNFSILSATSKAPLSKEAQAIADDIYNNYLSPHYYNYSWPFK